MIQRATTGWLGCALARLLSLAFVGCLAACATSATIKPVAPDSQGQALAAGSGAVALRLSIGGLTAAQFFPFWQEMEVRQLEGGKPSGKFVVTMSPVGATGSATYLGNLPAGEFAIEKFASGSCGAICMTSSVTWPRGEGPRFVVESGKLTYFGSVLYETHTGGTASLIPSGAPDLESLHEWLVAYHHDLADLPVLVPAAVRSSATKQLYEAAQRRVIGLLNPNMLSNGDVLYTTLGSGLVHWSDSGGSRSIATGIEGRSSALLALSDRDWLVAGDFHQLRRTVDGGANWQAVKTRLPYGVIVGMYRGHAGEVIVLEQRGQQLEVYAGSLDTDVWRLVSQHEFSWSFLRGGDSGPQVVDSGRRLMISVPPSAGVLLDKDTYAETSFEFPGTLRGIGLSGDGLVRCRCNRSGFWVSSWLSRDDGKTWDEDPIERGAAVPQFRDAMNGYGEYAGAVRATHDGGRTWSIVYTPAKAYWPTLLTLYSVTFMFDGEQRIVGTDGLTRIYYSTDGGANWRTASN